MHYIKGRIFQTIDDLKNYLRHIEEIRTNQSIRIIQPNRFYPPSQNTAGLCSRTDAMNLPFRGASAPSKHQEIP